MCCDTCGWLPGTLFTAFSDSGETETSETAQVEVTDSGDLD